MHILAFREFLNFGPWKWPKNRLALVLNSGKQEKIVHSFTYNIIVYSVVHWKKLLNFEGSAEFLNKNIKKALLKQMDILTFQEPLLLEDRVSMGIVPTFAYYS